jgi:hypothetical protein
MGNSFEQNALDRYDWILVMYRMIDGDEKCHR